MIETTVVLSDGLPCKVKRLGVFDLDGKGPAPVGPYSYTYELASGKTVEDVYDPLSLSVPPVHPGVPENEIVKGTPHWYALLEWQTYKAAIAHEYTKRLPVITQTILEVSKWIADAAVDPVDRSRIVDDADWDAVLEAALVPQVTIEAVARSLRDNFSASFDGDEIFKAIEKVESGLGEYNAIRLWEVKAISESGMTEEQWASLTVDERVRRVTAVGLPALMETLESDAAAKEARRGV